MENNFIEISEAIETKEPRRSDCSKSNNGGDYAFGVREVFQNGQKIAVLQWYSGEFSRCEITGQFTRTLPVILEGGHTIQVSEHEARYFEQDEEGELILSIEEFKNLSDSYSEPES